MQRALEVARVRARRLCRFERDLLLGVELRQVLVEGLRAVLAPAPCFSQSKATDQPSLLLRDKRLVKRMLIPVVSTTTGTLYTRVYRATTARLYTEESELTAAPLDIANNGKSAAALMDAISALWLARWEKEYAAWLNAPAEKSASQEG